MVLRIFNLLGSAMLLTIVAYILVDLYNNKKTNVNAIIGRIFVLVVLFIGLLRT